MGNATSGTVSNLISGVTYFFVATAYDTYGQESDFSNEVSYSVPSPTDDPPALALTAPGDGLVYTGPVTLNLAADVTPNGHAIGQVQFFNGVILLGVSTTVPYSFSWNGVSVGTYTLRAQVIYDSGSAVASAPVGVTVAAMPPPSGLTFAPYSGATGLQAGGVLTWGPSSDSAVAGYRVYEGVASGVYADMMDVGNVTSVTISNLSRGVTYFFAVTAYDTNGIESDFSYEVSYAVPSPADNPPTLVLAAPADGALYTAPAAITFTADVVPNGHSIGQVQFYDGVKLLGVSAVAPYGFSWTNVGGGTYSLSAQVVYDSDSTVVSAPVSVAVAGVMPPSALIFAPYPATTTPQSGGS